MGVTVCVPLYQTILKSWGKFQLEMISPAALECVCSRDDKPSQ